MRRDERFYPNSNCESENQSKGEDGSDHELGRGEDIGGWLRIKDKARETGLPIDPGLVKEMIWGLRVVG